VLLSEFIISIEMGFIFIRTAEIVGYENWWKLFIILWNKNLLQAENSIFSSAVYVL
jgi:hypothetical protein